MFGITYSTTAAHTVLIETNVSDFKATTVLFKIVVFQVGQKSKKCLLYR